jgi:hypothetical protein
MYIVHNIYNQDPYPMRHIGVGYSTYASSRYGFHGVPWTMKHSGSCEVTYSPKSMADTEHCSDKANGACNDIQISQRNAYRWDISIL